MAFVFIDTHIRSILSHNGIKGHSMLIYISGTRKDTPKYESFSFSEAKNVDQSTPLWQFCPPSNSYSQINLDGLSLSINQLALHI